MDLDNRLLEINRSLFCEECHRRALDFLEAATSAVCNADTEPAITLQTKVEAPLEAILLLHEACPRCKEE